MTTSSSCSRLCSVVNTGSLTRSGAERTRRRLKLGLDCTCASALWTDNCRNWPPRDRGPSCAGRPQVTATKRGPSTAQPLLPQRSHATPDRPRAPRPPSTIDVKTPSLRLAFHSADAIAIAASADVRALAAPHARHNLSWPHRYRALCRGPAKGPKPSMPGLARQAYLAGRGRGSRALAGGPLPRKPKHRAKNRPQAGQRPVVLRENNS